MKGRSARIWHTDAGTAAVEFALVLSLVSLMLIGVADFGVAMYRAIQVSDAVNFATSYKLANPDATEAEVQDKALSALSGIDQVSVSATTVCRCDNDTQKCIAANEDACVAGGGFWREFITVDISASITPIIEWPGIPNPITVSASSTKVIP